LVKYEAFQQFTAPLAEPPLNSENRDHGVSQQAVRPASSSSVSFTTSYPEFSTPRGVEAVAVIAKSPAASRRTGSAERPLIAHPVQEIRGRRRQREHRPVSGDQLLELKLHAQLFDPRFAAESTQVSPPCPVKLNRPA
jgi:hypothetical protein